jgi:hypothetical protein
MPEKETRKRSKIPGVSFYFTCKFLNSTSQFLSSIDCLDQAFGFQISPHWGGGRRLKSDEHTGDDTAASLSRPIQRPVNFRTAVNALNDCKMAEQRRVEIACENTS